MRDARQLTPIASPYAEVTYLHCSPAYVNTIKMANALCEAFLTSDKVFVDDFFAKNLPGQLTTESQSALWEIISCDIDSNSKADDFLLCIRSSLAFDMTNHIAMSKVVSIQLIRSLELLMFCFMGQWDRLYFWLSEHGVLLSDERQYQLYDWSQKQKLISPPTGLSPQLPESARCAYELSKVLQRFWSESHPSFSVWRDGLSVRYTQEPAPYCAETCPKLPDSGHAAF